jgi:hypothetical protein
MHTGGKKEGRKEEEEEVKRINIKSLFPSGKWNDEYIKQHR